MTFTFHILKDIMISVGLADMLEDFEGESNFERIRTTPSDSMCIKDATLFIPLSNDLRFDRLICELDSLNSWYIRLLEACTEKDAPKRILDIGTEKFRNPIAYFDSNKNLLCYSGEFSNPIEGTIWEPVLTSGFAPNSFYTLSEWWDVTNGISTPEKPKPMKIAADPRHEILSMGIFSHGYMIGALGVTDLNGSFSVGQTDILAIIGNTLGRAYGVYENSAVLGYTRDSFFERIIAGENIPNNQISAQIARYGWREGDCFRLIYLYSSSNETISLDHTFIAFKNLFPGCICCRSGGSGALIIRANQLTEIDETSVDEMRRELARNKVFGIIGSRFRGFKYLRAVFLSCDEAKEYIDKTKIATDNLIRYEDLYEQMVGDELGADNGMRKYVNPIIMEMAESGNHSYIELIKDLYAFMVSGENLTKASELRFVHRSSFTYRINKLSELLSIDVTKLSRKEAAYLYVSCMIVLGKEHML